MDQTSLTEVSSFFHKLNECTTEKVKKHWDRAMGILHNAAHYWTLRNRGAIARSLLAVSLDAKGLRYSLPIHVQ